MTDIEGQRETRAGHERTGAATQAKDDAMRARRGHKAMHDDRILKQGMGATSVLRSRKRVDTARCLAKTSAKAIRLAIFPDAAHSRTQRPRDAKQGRARDDHESNGKS
ncbi:hypothetical protein [Pararobbsia silviterrae]|uniref:hypothetical protein n=1 Tax=Pararobbsia silviterrae TaxID=1792498 RepID=UPI001408E853|nr:hypothetical protein [Pararobbsia silviterrae]